MSSVFDKSALYSVKPPRISARDSNRLLADDRPAHDWYRFILSFPPHLVRDYLKLFNVQPAEVVLDPFCGTGTTLVEAKKLGFSCIGLEANQMAAFASSVKTDWTGDADELVAHASEVAEVAHRQLLQDGIPDDSILCLESSRVKEYRSLEPDRLKLLLTDSISPAPLHKVLVLLDAIQTHQQGGLQKYEILALAKALVTRISNLHFGPEVGVGPAKEDCAVISTWLSCVCAIADDLRTLKDYADVPSCIHTADAREAQQVIDPRSVDIVITSPPYPNEKDYTRTTRLESVLLGFITDKKQLRDLKRGLVRSNTRSVYVDDQDHHYIIDNTEVNAIAAEIERRRIEMGKTSGFERQYAKVTKQYFGGMARHLANLRAVLRPGARLAYVVGDQASYLRVMIRTGCILGEIASSLGYEVNGLDLFRTRTATATRAQLREEVLLLSWPGL